MTEPLSPPKRKNPLARTRRTLLPPSARSRTAHGLTLAAAEGRFALQRCGECGKFTYPPRDACPECLSSQLVFVEAPVGGVLVTSTTIHVTGDSYFREHMPWRQGIVVADCGPRIIAHLHADCTDGERVNLSLRLDKAGQPVVFAAPSQRASNMQDDPALREMTADPRYRRVLITNGRHPATEALVRSFKDAGATSVFVGVAEAWKPLAGEDRLGAIDGVQLLPLDLTDQRSVFNLAADIAGKVDILVNTADHVRPVHLFEPAGTRKLMEAVNATVAGTMNLAQAFGPAMAGRGADGVNSAAAWVNLLSAYALANAPEFGAVSVSHAACLSLSHWLRAELRKGGVRLLNAFAGPLDDEWYQSVPAPRVSAGQLADSIIDGLRRGLEEIYVGDIARDIRARLAANPKALEREIGR